MTFKNKCWLFIMGLLCALANVAHANTVDELFRKPGDPIAGNPRGTVTLVEFFDYQCSHCVTMSPIIAALIKSNADLRVVFKEFPIRGAISEFATRAALAANLQGSKKYLIFNHLLMTSPQPLNAVVITQLAEKARLNTGQLQRDIYGSTVVNQMRSNQRLATELQLPGTPAFFIGKTNAKHMQEVTVIPGLTSQATLQDAIIEAAKQ